MSYKQAMELKKPIRVVYELYKQDHYEQAKSDFAKQMQEQHETDYPTIDENGEEIEYVDGYCLKESIEQEDGTFAEEWVLYPIDSDKPVKPSFDSYLEMKFDTEFTYTELQDQDILPILVPYTLQRINTLTQQAMEGILAQFPEFEVLSWKTQEEEARNYLDSNNPNDAPTLQGISNYRGIDLLTLAQKVLTKAAAYKTASGAVMGIRQRAEDIITTATTIDELITAERLVNENV